jgi:hypothetical protein
MNKTFTISCLVLLLIGYSVSAEGNLYTTKSDGWSYASKRRLSVTKAILKEFDITNQTEIVLARNGKRTVLDTDKYSKHRYRYRIVKFQFDNDKNFTKLIVKRARKSSSLSNDAFYLLKKE